MRKAIVAAVMVTVLGVAGVASAAPTYGSKHTYYNGYIVWVRGDSHPSHVNCHWTAGNSSWHFSYNLRPYQYRWTTSDAGSYGDFRPQGLSCTYYRI
jgi:hypothetical protein